MNMGKTDRIIRAVVGIVLVLVGALALGGAVEIVLVVIGAVLLLTAAVGFCPLYWPFHFSTKPKSK